MSNSPSSLRNKAANATAAGAAKARLSGDGADEMLERIADALERLAPAPPAAPDFAAAEAFVWHPEGRRLRICGEGSPRGEGSSDAAQAG